MTHKNSFGRRDVSSHAIARVPGSFAPGIYALSLILALGFSAANPAQSNTALADRYYEEAELHFYNDDYRAARIELKNALQEDPDNLKARMLLGRVHLSLEDGAAAEKEFLWARERGADENLLAAQLAKAYLLQGKYALIVEEFPPADYDSETRLALTMLRAQAYHGLRQLDRAESEYIAATRLSPENSSPWVGRAEVSLDRGNRELAEEQVDRAIALDAANARAWFLKGEMRRLQGDQAGSISGYDGAVRLDPDYLEARISRAAVLVDLNFDERAMKDIEYVRAAVPDHPQAVYLVAFLHAREGDLDGARAILRQAAESLDGVPQAAIREHPPSLLIVGVIAFAEGNFEQTRDYLGRYIAVQPDHPGARKILAAALLALDEPTQAADVLQPALTLVPDDASVYALLGSAYAQSGRHSEAAEMFEKAVNLAPDSTSIRTQLALNELALGHTGEAEGELASILALDSTTADASALLCLMQLKEGDYDAALHTAQAMRDHNPQNPEAYNLMGAAHAGKQALDEARVNFERALSLDQNFVPAQHNLAALELAAGDMNQARKRYRQILGTRPQDAQALMGLAGVAEAEGDTEKAIIWMEQLRSGNPRAIPQQLQLFELYMRSKKYDEALSLARDLNSVQADTLLILDALVRSQTALGKDKAATETLNHMAGLAGGSAQWLHRIARHQMGLKDFTGARQSLEQALGADPGLLAAAADLVSLDIREGRTDKALARADELVARYPDLALGYALRGEALVHEQRFADAIAAYEAGYDRQPSATLIARLYRARSAANKLPEIVPVLEEWVTEHPSDQEARGMLARAYLETGDLVAAIREHEQLQKQLPDQAGILNNLAWLYYKTGDPRALSYAEKAHQLAPEEAAILDTLGWILVQQGEPRRGLNYLQEAHLRASRDPSIRYHKAVALDQLGRHKQAQKELEIALKSKENFDGVAEARALSDKLRGY
jgi:putative PEP-CTERM system TPR-repeat lipoprotein